jgi:glycosyltransferase involved in cell wall biosynthesis
MKVVFLTSFPQNLSSPKGGVEAVSVNLVKALVELNDMEIHVVTLDSRVSSAQENSFNGIKVHRLPEPKGSVLLVALTSGRRLVSDYLKKLKPDLIHSHDTYGLMVKGLEFPKVFTVHGFIFKDTRVSGIKMPRLRSALWKWFETRGWADQPHIIAISPYVRERLSGRVKGTIHDIENSIAKSFFSIQRHERESIIFSAAVISPRKNTLALVDAIATLIREGVDVQLRLAGTVAERSYGQAVNSRIDSYGLQGKINMLGPIPIERVQAELAQASVFALVSIEENAPLCIEEAMAVGVPVVASNRCGMPYMVRHGETGFLVNPFDSNDIAKRIRQLLNDRNLRHEMGKKSRRWALHTYHPELVAKRTLAVYSEAIQNYATLR